MDSNRKQASKLPLEERRFHEETTAKDRELSLKEREVVTKEEDLRRSRWLSPIVIALFAAAVGLIGNIVVAQVNNQSSQRLEHLRLQSNLVLEAIKTGDPDEACKNLVFFVGLGLLDDPNKTISGACSPAPKGAPSLPAQGSSQDSSQDLSQNVRVHVKVYTVDEKGQPVQGLHIHYQLIKDRLGHSFEFLQPPNSPLTLVLPPGIYDFWTTGSYLYLNTKLTATIRSDMNLTLRVYRVEYRVNNTPP